MRRHGVPPSHVPLHPAQGLHGKQGQLGLYSRPKQRILRTVTPPSHVPSLLVLGLHGNQGQLGLYN